MADKDIISKDILKRIAVDIAQILLHLKVDRAEIIDTEYQCIEDRRADLVAYMQGEQEEFILHIEIQNENRAIMPWRMLRYRAEIAQARPHHDIRQYLLYIGKAPLTMVDHIQQTGLDYYYQVIDMHTVDCQMLLAQDTPDALVLAILCDFKNRPSREIVGYIVRRLRDLTAENESRFREYMRMLEILSTNRGLDKLIEEEQSMLSQVDQTRLPSYRIGMKKGEEWGMEKGMKKEAINLLQRQLTRRFGSLDETTLQRLNNADVAQLEHWADQIFDAETLDDIFCN